MLFLKRQSRNGDRDLNVHEGAIYRREWRYNLVEVARVLSVGPDAAGIPHVRFHLSYVGPDFTEEQGTRLLALTSFAALYGSHASPVARPAASPALAV